MFKLIFSCLLIIVILRQSRAAAIQKNFTINLNGTLFQPSSKQSKSYYFLSEGQRSWHEANFYCESLGWKLLAIEDSDEFYYLKSYLSYIKKLDLAYWTSGNDLNSCKVWTWGDNLKQINDFFWANNQEENLSGQCIRTNAHSFEWSQADCINERLAHICEVENK